MKSFIFAIVCAALCSTSFGGECVGGSCRMPIRNTLSTTVHVAERVISAPVRAAKKFVSKVRQRRHCRNCH